MTHKKDLKKKIQKQRRVIHTWMVGLIIHSIMDLTKVKLP